MIDKIIAYEQGDLSDEDTVTLFQRLIDTGQAWTLQGHYGRTASALIEAGVCHTPAPAEDECQIFDACTRPAAYAVPVPGREVPVPGCRHHIESLDL